MCDDGLDEHVWVSVQTISCQEVKVLEALHNDLDNPRIVQWRMLWFSAPIRYQQWAVERRSDPRETQGSGEFGQLELLDSAFLDGGILQDHAS